MNRATIIDRLVSAGVEAKETVKLSKEIMVERASFFEKLIKAQAEMEKVFKDQKGPKGAYAAVDQFVEKTGEAMQKAGLAMFCTSAQDVIKTFTDPNGIEQTRANWEIEILVGDAKTGYQQQISWSIPIGKEQVVGASDSYALKYAARGVMFAERAKDDPDRRRDIDRVGSQGQQPAPKAPSMPKNNMVKKPTKRATQSKVAEARERLKKCSDELGAKKAREIMEAAGFKAPKGVKELCQVADLLEARIVFNRLCVRSEETLGKESTIKLLEGCDDLANIVTLQTGIETLVTALDKGASNE